MQKSTMKKSGRKTTTIRRKQAPLDIAEMRKTAKPRKVGRRSRRSRR